MGQAGGHGERHVGDLHARDDGHENLAAAHQLETAEHETDALIEGDPEPRHARIGHRQGRGALADQPAVERHHAAPRVEHVAVTHHGKPRAVLAAQIVGGDEDLIRGQLACAIEIDRADRLVGRQGDDPLDPGPYGRRDDVFGAVDVGAHTFERIVFRRRNLLQRRRVDHIIHIAHGHFQPVNVAHVADEEA